MNLKMSVMESERHQNERFSLMFFGLI